MDIKTAELLLAHQQLKDAQQRVELLQIELEKSDERYAVEWTELGRRHRTVFDCMDSAADFWKDISAVFCPILYKVFV